MRKTLISILLSAAITYYFSASGETGYPGIFLKQEFSGFKRIAECEDFRAEFKAVLEAMGATDVKVSQCSRRDDA